MTEPGVILGYGNLVGVSFEERVAAAAAAGADAIGYSVFEFQDARRAGITAKELAGIAERSGIRVAELEIGLGFDGPADGRRWQPTGFPWDLPYMDAGVEQDLIELAGAFGAHHVVVAASTGGQGTASTARFARLCDRAAEVGAKVAIEFLPGTDMPDIASALAVVEAADRDNGGLCVDNWHFMRGNRDDAALQSLPADRVVVVQLSDGPVAPRTDDYFEETLRHRMLFGDGDWDVAGFLATLRGTGTTAPVSIEILSEHWQGRPVLETAKAFVAAARALESPA
ncbi:MAG: sugar phosphate isomerase/epimerase [Pseudonocardia sp.]|uniref:sugar phosphate isomerase/epimerase family protein n=1 Tax=unclassified Pseudonocardia TaxID=2619320 RepID=UPI001AC0ED3E|nr:MULTISPECIES: sugar phosphate isomerase/epimerase [unclassified Pseudonocardia]MBN9110730.1 sugar phosphate isomerase/epimerase [Pseudonocardia sp.]